MGVYRSINVGQKAVGKVYRGMTQIWEKPSIMGDITWEDFNISGFDEASSDEEFAYFHFLSSGDVVFATEYTCDIALIGGGGAGGNTNGGGGGAGDVVLPLAVLIPVGSHPLVIGDGGGASDTASVRQGQDSTFWGYTAIGGGAGARSQQDGFAGGSGGGGCRAAPAVGGEGIGENGHDGGATTGTLAGGGGGGSQDPGLPGTGSGPSNLGGKGGDGVPVFGLRRFAAGGGGAGVSSSGGNPGLGGGGSASNNSSTNTGTPPEENTGSGSGGLRDNSSLPHPGAKGRLILRIALTEAA